jgi:CHAT domain-containing protein/predicted negative regulator of RcsB-dependent stress response
MCQLAVSRGEAVRAGRALAIGILVCSLVLPDARAHHESAPAGQEPQEEIRSLEPDHAVEGKLAGRARHVYELNLSQGQFLRFTLAVENPATNIQLTVVDPDGGKIEALSGPACPVALFSLYFLPSVSGAYRLRLELSRGDASPEGYKLQIDELREATDLDKTRTAAGHALVEAYRLSAQDSPASKQQAAQKFEKAIALFRSAGDRRGEAEVSQTLSFRSFVARDYQAAVDYLRQAQPLWHALADYSREAAALESMANNLGRLGKPQEALDALNQAVPLRHALGDPGREALALNALGDAYDAMGEFQEALNAYEQAHSLFRVAGNEDGALGDLGHVYEELGEPQKALDYYEQALKLARSHGNRGLETSLLCVIAGAYAEAGDRDKALEKYKQALALDQGDQGGEAWDLQKLGAFYVEQGEYEKALRCLDQTLSYYRGRHRPMLEALTLYWMGAAYRKEGKWQQALEALNQALSTWPIKNRWRRVIAQEIGSVYLDSGESSKALEIFQKSLSESRAAKDAQREALAFCDIARAERALHQTPEARRDVEAGLSILESVRARVAGAESRASYFATVQKNCEFYIDLLMQMHAEHPEQGLDAAALQASERARARSLLDMFVEAHADIHQGADPRLLERERGLQQRLRARSEYQVQLLTREHTSQEAKALGRELQALTAEYEEAEAQIRATSPRYAALTQPVPLDLKQTQDRVVDSDTLLLEYALGEDRSYLWAVTGSTLTSFTLPGRAEIERATRRVYELLTARNRHPKGEGEAQREARMTRARAEYPSAAAHLSAMVLGPAASLLGHKRLLIASDGALQYIPFAVLPVPRQGKRGGEPDRPLAVESEIVTVPSASMVAVLRRDLAARRPAPKAVAVLADPVFDSQDPRVPALIQVAQVRPAGEITSQRRDLPMDLERSWAEVVSAERGWRIPRLPFSRREAKAIIAAASPASTLEAVDFQASRATATSAELAQYRVVHFATHGVLDSRTPALSGIILSLVDRQGRSQDGFLRLWDIYNLHLPADLVVLSACQTALGKEIKGEGLVGLTRGFMYAGAARVIASLWQVDDVATAELMSQFYQSFLKKNLSPAAALRAAQITMWKQKRWQDPYFWGAFQIQGEWN